MTDLPSRSCFFSLADFLDSGAIDRGKNSPRDGNGNAVRPGNESFGEPAHQNEVQLRYLLENTREGLVILDAIGTVLFVNPAAERLFRRPADTLVGENLGIPIAIDEFSEVEIPHPDGSLKRVSLRALEFSWEGRAAYLAFLQDITDLKRAEELVKILYRAVEQSPAAIVITDARGRIEYANSKYEKLTGYTTAETIGAEAGYRQYLEMPGELYRDLQEAIARGREWSGEFLNRKKNGERFWERVSIAPILDETGRATHFVAVKEDISERKQQEALLCYQANHDTLTNLPNRSLALDRLQQAIARAKRHNQRVGLLFIDLDHFKDVNDTLGHEYGDRLLQEVAARLVGCLRDSDTVARLGGDEFLVILPELDRPDRCEPIAGKILSSLEIPFELSGEEVFISASIGCTVYPDDAEDISSLLRNADIAMYGIKRDGRDGFKYYTPDMNEKAMFRVNLAYHLRHALDRSEISIAYQPVVELRSGRPVGAEALMRWDHPEYGRVSPARFIPIAEETGSIERLGAWILEGACREAAGWHRSGYPLSVAVNLSPRQLRDSAFLDKLVRSIGASGLNLGFLELEMTEALLIEDVPRALPILDRLRKMGIGLSVDDFGTGYSALSYLRDFRFTCLKIDRSFIRDLPAQPEAGTLAKTIVAMARGLGLRTIAEGVETREQMEFLLDIGCDRGQGYYFSPPLTAGEFRQYLALHHR
ncbi:EAL domain-containing protein [Pannus brasiliensis CCIBt3594]|uniref:EAL domain-containing protein n=1 Tax=Pannus brasiliensis CCIBt3594 TaxID=1427578 RepID=A0AAW9QFM1_9CHRO